MWLCLMGLWLESRNWQISTAQSSRTFQFLVFPCGMLKEGTQPWLALGPVGRVFGVGDRQSIFRLRYFKFQESTWHENDGELHDKFSPSYVTLLWWSSDDSNFWTPDALVGVHRRPDKEHLVDAPCSTATRCKGGKGGKGGLPQLGRNLIHRSVPGVCLGQMDLSYPGSEACLWGSSRSRRPQEIAVGCSR